MKKTFTVAAILSVLAGPALADPLNVIRCGLLIVPAQCEPGERIIGGALVGAALGLGVGAIAGTTGATISGGMLAAKGTAAVAWSGAAIGAMAGGGMATTLLVAGGR